MKMIPLVNIKLSLSLPYISIKDLKIEEKVGEHGKLYLLLEVDASANNDVISRIQGENISVLSDTGATIFVGICLNSSLKSLAGYNEVVIEGITTSYTTDIEKKNVTFQNPTKTLKSVMEEIFAPYNSIINIDTDENITYILSQRAETDWKFLNRIAAQYGKSVFVDSRQTALTINIGEIGFLNKDIDFKLKEIIRDMGSVRIDKANLGTNEEVFEYEKKRGITYDITAAVGDKTGENTISQITIYSKGGILENDIVLQHAQTVRVNTLANINKQMESQILIGVVQEVKDNQIKVKFGTDGSSGGQTTWLTYENTINNSFYCMPDVNDEVFIYYDNSGLAVCLGSKRILTEEPDFDNPKEKSITSDNSMIRLGESALSITTTKSLFEKGSEEAITIIMDENEGITVKSGKDILIEADKRMIISAINEGANETDFDDAKEAFESLDRQGETKYAEDGGVNGIQIAGRYVGSLLDKFAYDWNESVKSGLYFEEIDKIKKWLFPEDETDRILEKYDTGIITMTSDTDKLQIIVGDSFIDISDTSIHFVSENFRWLGTTPNGHDIDSVENRNWLDTGLDALQLGLDIVGVIPGIGVIPDLINAGISVARGDYFGAAVSLFCAIPGVGDVAGAGKVVIKVADKAKAISDFFNGIKAYKRVKLFGTYTIFGLETVRNEEALIELGQAVANIFISDPNDKYEVNLTVDDFIGILSWGYSGAGPAVKKKLENSSGSGGESGNATKHKTTESDSKTTQKENGNDTSNTTHDGDPVDMVTGSLYLNHIDKILKDTLEDFNITRTYESVYYNENKLLGSRWLLNIESNISILENKLIVRMPDNHMEHFMKDEKCWINERNDDKSFLLGETDGGYCLKVLKEKKRYCYNSEGRLISIYDRNDNCTRLEYDGKTLVKLTLSSGQFLLFSYDKNKVNCITDNIGRKITYEYEGDLLTKVTYPNSGAMRYEYTLEGYIYKVWDQKGKNYITNHYDRKGRVVGQNMSDGEEYIYLYDDKNKTNTIITASNNRTVRYEYNRNKVVTKTIYQDDTYKETKYDEWENPIYEKDRNGFETFRKYNAKCQLMEETLPEGLITNYEYDEDGNLIYKHDNAGRELKLTYDNRGNIIKRQTKIDESTWQQQLYSYDAKGRLVSTVNSNHNEVKRYFNTSFNQPSVYVNAAGEEFHYTYDEAGRKMSVKGELGTVKYGYNNLDYKTHIIDNNGNTTRLYYDPMNNLVKVIKPNELNTKTEDGPGTSFEYDDMDHLIRVTNPLGNINAYVKDSEGHVLKEFNPNTYDYLTGEGEGVEYKYDTDGNRTHIIYPNGGIERIFYDPNGNIIKKIQPLEYNQETDDGKGYTYLYDGNNRLIQITNPMGIVEKRYVYNLAGKIIKEIDTKGYLGNDNDKDRIGTLYQYNTIGWLAQKREPVKVDHEKVSYRLTCYFYDNNGNIIKEKRYLDYQDEESKSGRVHTIEKQYDKNERLIKVSDCTGAAMEYQYNSHNQLTYEKRKISDNTYMEKIYSYDSAGRLEFIKVNADETGTGKRYAKTLYEYDKNGNLIKITTPTGNEIRREYDAANNLVFESHIEKNGSIHNKTSFSYDKSGNLIKITDNAQNSLEYKYDLLNREVAKIGIDGGVSTTDYDLNSRILRVTSPNENRTIDKAPNNATTDSLITNNSVEHRKDIGYQYSYDILGRITAITRPDGVREQISSYNDAGELIQQADAAGSEIYFTYDFAGRRTGAKTNGAASQSYEYDALGNIIGVKDGNNYETQYKLDKWGRIVSIIRADETTEEYAYDYAGNVIKTVDGKGHATSYEYNSLNLLSKMTDPIGEVEEYIYDLENRLKEHTDRNKNTTSYSYNLYGNITLKKSLNENLQESYEYYQDGKLKSAIAQGMRYDYVYYPNGLLKEKQASGRTLIAYEYDSNGNKTKQTDITGKVTEYRYNKLNQLIEVYDGEPNSDDSGKMLDFIAQSDNYKRQALYEYNLDGSISKITIGDNIVSSYAYDLDKNISALKTSLGQEDLVSFDYSYDGNANMLTKESFNQTTSFEYDNLNRIVKAEYPTYSEELFYDNAGNRERRVSQGLEELYQYDERNRLIEKATRSVESGNDALELKSNAGVNGNGSVNFNTGEAIHSTISNPVNETIHYEYDNQGNLLKDNHITYTYDAFNRTVKAQTTSGKIQINRYDAEGLRHEIEENGKLVQFLYSGKEIIVEKTQDDTIRYIRGYGIISSDSEKARIYYHYVSDEANSVTHVTDENTVLNKYEYDAFGNTTSCEENVHNPFRYRGQQFDSITNQYYLRARYYNPVIGRFTQEDTYHGDGLNLYAYCANNPVKYYDPSGYSKVDANDNQKALQDIVDEVNERGGATPEERRIIEDWADEYGVPKDNLGLESQKLLPGPTSSGGVEPKAKVPSSKGSSGTSGRTFNSQYNIPVNDKGYTKSSLELGKKVHKEYKAGDVDNITKFKEYVLPSGKRVDYIDFETKTVYELKPYNPNQIKKGTKQLQNYLEEIEREFGDGWTMVLDTY